MKDRVRVRGLGKGQLGEERIKAGACLFASLLPCRQAASARLVPYRGTPRDSGGFRSSHGRLEQTQATQHHQLLGLAEVLLNRTTSQRETSSILTLKSSLRWPVLLGGANAICQKHHNLKGGRGETTHREMHYFLLQHIFRLDCFFLIQIHSHLCFL